MNVLVRDAVQNDMKQVLMLIKELAKFEKEPNAVILNEEQLVRDGFSENPKFKCFIAESNDEIIGMALGYPRYSTWKGVTMHLEDLIVTKSRRGNGIGSLLFSKFINYAHSLRVKRIEWAVLDWNVNAIEFYEKNGAKILSDWRVAQMDEDSIKKFCNNESI
jgi:GNAT superfamily N-acetyltransferase